jgi:hypothetical protein
MIPYHYGFFRGLILELELGTILEIVDDKIHTYYNIKQIKKISKPQVWSSLVKH